MRWNIWTFLACCWGDIVVPFVFPRRHFLLEDPKGFVVYLWTYWLIGRWSCLKYVIFGLEHRVMSLKNILFVDTSCFGNFISEGTTLNISTYIVVWNASFHLKTSCSIKRVLFRKRCLWTFLNLWVNPLRGLHSFSTKNPLTQGDGHFQQHTILFEETHCFCFRKAFHCLRVSVFCIFTTQNKF